MKKLFALTFFLILSLTTFGSHIVGGEFELIYISKNFYRINLIVYFDVLNGNVAARDDLAYVSIFRKSDDSRVRNIFLLKEEESRVDYFQPECSNGEVVTDKIIYSTNVLLSDEEYSDPEGYYLVWQRCCRNYTITNIYSAEPTNGTTAGQTFYLEFPPVVDANGDEFVNSSPQLFPPLNDYGCPNRSYWVDFAGTDVDGDSLVYELASPLSTGFSSAFPNDDPQSPPDPAPYPNVIWKPGFGLNNITGGRPDLEISDDGFLTVTPRTQGLFVFAVKVSEYRDNVKIGEVRRDFQLWVVDKCPVADPPQIKGKKSSDVNFTYDNSMNVTFDRSLAQEERCIQVQISDPDALKDEEGFREDVWVKAIPLNFKEEVDEILPSITRQSLISGSTFDLDVCFPECPYREAGPYQVGIVAFDDACALPLSDTLVVTVNVEPPPNRAPYFVNGSQITKEVVEQKDGFWAIDIIARDDDNDEMSVLVLPEGFVPDEYGMSIVTYQNTAGEVRTRFEWNYDCTTTSFDGKNNFTINFLVEDFDQCLFNHTNMLSMDLKVILPENTLPEIYRENEDRDTKYFRFERSVYESLSFTAISEDIDNDPIVVEGVGSNFSFEDYDITFQDRTGTGNPGITTPFSWNLSCESFKDNPQDSFRFYLMVEDFDYCNITSRDTLTIDLIVNEIENTPPSTGFNPLTEGITIDSEIELTSEIDKILEIEVSATDPDPNNVSIELFGLDGPRQTGRFEFTDVTGFQSAKGLLRWSPNCEDLNFETGNNTYTFIFRVTDDDCRDPSEEFIEYTINLNDIFNDIEAFEPPNFFSPNGDDYNNFFALEYLDEDGKLITTGLPRDNCRSVFEEIKIFNRWGREVFSSSDRQFKWFGEGNSTGVYYYYVRFTEQEFKGSITLLF